MRRAVYALIGAIILVFALGFPAYMAFGQAGGHSQVYVTVTATPVVSGGGGGGGGGGVPAEAECPSGQTSIVGRITSRGEVLRTIVVTSLEGQFQLTIDIGTIALQRDGSPIRCIGILKTDNLPSPPEGAYVVSVWYDVFPDEATFSPSATLQYTAEPGTIPTKGDGDRLVIAYNDEATGTWVELDSITDTEAGTITAKVTQFNDIAVFGYGVVAPAAFQVSSLSASPRVVYTGGTVTITALVTNTGGQAGSYQVILKVNGAAEATQEVTLGAGASERISFTTTKETAGTYSVDINGITGTFEVRERVVIPPPEPFNWWLIILIIAAMAIAAETVYVLRKQKEHGGITGALAVEVKGVASLGPKIGKAAALVPKLAPKIGKAASLIARLASKLAAAVRSLFSKIKITKG